MEEVLFADDVGLGQGDVSVRSLIQNLAKADDVSSFDVAIVTLEGEHHYCHSALLAVASPFLRGLLLDGEPDAVGRHCLYLPNISSHIVETFLEILYCGPDPDYYEYSLPDLWQMTSLASMLQLDFGSQQQPLSKPATQNGGDDEDQDNASSCDLLSLQGELSLGADKAGSCDDQVSISHGFTSKDSVLSTGFSDSESVVDEDLMEGVNPDKESLEKVACQNPVSSNKSNVAAVGDHKEHASSCDLVSLQGEPSLGAEEVENCDEVVTISKGLTSKHSVLGPGFSDSESVDSVDLIEDNKASDDKTESTGEVVCQDPVSSTESNVLDLNVEKKDHECGINSSVKVVELTANSQGECPPKPIKPPFHQMDWKSRLDMYKKDRSRANEFRLDPCTGSLLDIASPEDFVKLIKQESRASSEPSVQLFQKHGEEHRIHRYSKIRNIKAMSLAIWIHYQKEHLCEGPVIEARDGESLLKKFLASFPNDRALFGTYQKKELLRELARDRHGLHLSNSATDLEVAHLLWYHMIRVHLKGVVPDDPNDPLSDDTSALPEPEHLNKPPTRRINSLDGVDYKFVSSEECQSAVIPEVKSSAELWSHFERRQKAEMQRHAETHGIHPEFQCYANKIELSPAIWKHYMDVHFQLAAMPGESCLSDKMTAAAEGVMVSFLPSPDCQGELFDVKSKAELRNCFKGLEWETLLRNHALVHQISVDNASSANELCLILWKHYMDVHLNLKPIDDVNEENVIDITKFKLLINENCKADMFVVKSEAELWKCFKGVAWKVKMQSHACKHKIPGFDSAPASKLCSSIWRHYMNAHFRFAPLPVGEQACLPDEVTAASDGVRINFLPSSECQGEPYDIKSKAELQNCFKGLEWETQLRDHATLHKISMDSASAKDICLSLWEHYMDVHFDLKPTDDGNASNIDGFNTKFKIMLVKANCKADVFGVKSESDLWKCFKGLTWKVQMQSHACKHNIPDFDSVSASKLCSSIWKHYMDVHFKEPLEKDESNELFVPVRPPKRKAKPVIISLKKPKTAIKEIQDSIKEKELEQDMELLEVDKSSHVSENLAEVRSVSDNQDVMIENTLSALGEDSNVDMVAETTQPCQSDEDRQKMELLRAIKSGSKMVYNPAKKEFRLTSTEQQRGDVSKSQSAVASRLFSLPSSDKKVIFNPVTKEFKLLVPVPKTQDTVKQIQVDKTPEILDVETTYCKEQSYKPSAEEKQIAAADEKHQKSTAKLAAGQIPLPKNIKRVDMQWFAADCSLCGNSFKINCAHYAKIAKGLSITTLVSKINYECYVCSGQGGDANLKTCKSCFLVHFRPGEHECPPQLVDCSTCGQQVETINFKLEYHMNEHMGITPFTCQECGIACHSRLDFNLIHRRNGCSKGPKTKRQLQLARCGVCPLCPEVNTRLHLELHHSQKRKYKCDECEYRSDFMDNDSRSIAFHKKRCHGGTGTRIICDQCPASFSRIDRLRRHVKSAHDPNLPFGCDQCNFRGLTQQTVAMHKGLYHSEKKYVCSNGCGRRFKNHSHWIAHAERWCKKAPKKVDCLKSDIEGGKYQRERAFRLKHKLVKRMRLKEMAKNPEAAVFQCQYCSTVEKTVLAIETHEIQCQSKPKRTFKNRIKIVRVQCPECSSVMPRSSLREHMRDIHSLAVREKCDYCKFEANTEKDIQDHVFEAHKEVDGLNAPMVKVQCPKCPTQLFKDYMNQHLREHHSPEIPEKCEHCEYRAQTRNDIQCHIFKAHLDLFKVGKSKSATTNGERLSYNSKEKVQCPMCPVIIVSRYHMKNHFRDHHAPEVPEKCEHCDYRAQSKTDIKSHMTCYHTVRHLPCPHGCGKMFSHHWNQTAHATKSCRLSPQADLFKMETREKKRAYHSARRQRMNEKSKSALAYEIKKTEEVVLDEET